MRVRAKVTLLLALLFAVLIGAQWAIQQQLVLPRFEELERASARTDMQRVQLAVERELQSLGSAASDWGNWADTWQYMLRPNPQYERSNLTDTAVRTLKVDYLALIAADGHFVWARAIDPLSGERTQMRLNHDDHLELAWQHALERGVSISGLIDTNAGVLLASGAPILDGFNHGPSRGMVIVGRLFDRAEQLRIGTQAQVNLSLSRWRGSAEAAAALPLDMQLAETPTAITVQQVLSDLSGRPLLTLGISVPRTITARGAQAVRYSTLSVSVAAAIVLAALLWMIGRIVLGPLGIVTGHAKRIAEADDLSARLQSARHDELGTLANSIDHMVERLAQSRRELIDRSFESGAADNAAGVLHELGNAMTPLVVHADALSELMAIMPIDDVRRGIDELFVDAPDSERQQELRRYLKLLAAELARSHERAGDSLRQLLEQAEAIQLTLASQQQQPRAGAVMQSITPAELVARGLGRLTAVQLSRLDVELSPGLAALDAMSLPCTALAMVLEKLALYSINACARAGLARARMRVTASSGGAALRLSLETNAGGVAPQELPGLFSKPVPGEQPAMGTGADLHWCANTLHALGGSIAAYSEGPASGIRFEISLPLGQANPQLAGRVA